MIKLRSGVQIYLSTSPTDMRKSIDTLSVLVADAFQHSPQSGHLFIFFNRGRDKVKILFWDKNGFVLYYKRMEKRRFVLPTSSAVMQWEITEVQLNGLLAGLDFEIMGDFEEINYEEIF
jgi:transposase